MNTFSNIKELLKTLIREHKLLTEMFEKRKTLSYKYDFALEMVDYEEERIRYLVSHSVIRENGNFLEIDDQFLQFFEQALEVNEEINTASINSNIQNVKENIIYYLKENNEARKYDYLRKVKNALRKIGNVTLRNVIDLNRNTENTFKNEPNYKVKKAKLENLDQKRIDINSLIQQTYYLVSEEEQTFFKSALDEELNRVITQLKLQLNECRHNLINIQKQIIEYLNQIKYQSGVIEKLRQIKYLKDQFTLRIDSDIESVFTKNNAVIFEPNPAYPLKLSLDYLQTDIHDIGTSNLFSTNEHTRETKNKTAIHLLTLLTSEIAKYKHNDINLSDTFELEFKVIENDNDTNWVQNLANVGSNGTDVLVKAMINIMLLNVFKEGATKNKFKDFRLHCMVDEIGTLHIENVRGLLKFANDRNIYIINGSPQSIDALAYRYTYKLAKQTDISDGRPVTIINRLVTNNRDRQ